MSEWAVEEEKIQKKFAAYHNHDEMLVIETVVILMTDDPKNGVTLGSWRALSEN